MKEEILEVEELIDRSTPPMSLLAAKTVKPAK